MGATDRDHALTGPFVYLGPVMVRILFRSIAFTVSLSAASWAGAQERELMAVRKGEVSFVSDAPLERIAATNSAVTGMLDLKQRTFVVRIPMRVFSGFNSPLQQEHFHENYVESQEFPNALFEGRVIEACDLSKATTYEVRAKGRFTVHGVAQERIITCTLVVAADGIRVTSAFDVPLADHGIRIPRVVQQKLAAVARVKVDLLFAPAPGK